MNMDKTYEISLRSKKERFLILASAVAEKNGRFEFKDALGQIVGRYRESDVEGYHIAPDPPDFSFGATGDTE